MPTAPEPDPAAIGAAMAEALVANLEKLKQQLGGGADGSPEAQLRAGELAIEAMKHLLPGVIDETRLL